MKKLVLLSAFFGIAIYGADEDQAHITRKRKRDDSGELTKKSRSEMSAGYTNIIIVDTTKVRHKPIIIETPSFISNQISNGADPFSEECRNFMENHIRNTFQINGFMSIYTPTQCIFRME